MSTISGPGVYIDLATDPEAVIAGLDRAARAAESAGARIQAAIPAKDIAGQFALYQAKVTKEIQADASRLASEIEKLALFAGEGGTVTAADIASLVPDAQETTIFNLVNALARRNRTQSMELLDTLVREGEYLPLALTFLGGLFRLALAAQEQGLRSANDVQSFFSRQGIAMWRSRAEQIYTASARFSPEKLKEGLQLVFRADKDLKSSRVDDRIVMEEFVLHLTR